MKFTTIAIVGAAGAAAESSPVVPPVYGAPTTAAPMPGQTLSNSAYVCNPAHSYPAGASCDGSGPTPTLVYPTTTPVAGYTLSNSAYVCNPAHSYPAGASCDSHGATPTLVYPTTTPVAGNTLSNSAYVCNPAHSYPAGASCDAHGATPTLVYPSVTPVPDVYTTEVVTALTTYCPSSTQITHGGKTYTVTSATTLTITDCPCTVTKPVHKPTTVPVKPTVSVDVPVYHTPVYETKSTEVPCPVTSVQSGSTTVYTTKSSTVITGYSTVITVKNTPPAVPTYPGASKPVESKPATQVISTFLPKPTGTCPAGQMAVPAPITQIADGQPQAPGSVSCVDIPKTAPAPSVSVDVPVYTPVPSVSVDVPVYTPAPKGTGSYTTPAGPRFTGAAAALKPAGAVAAALIGAAAFL